MSQLNISGWGYASCDWLEECPQNDELAMERHVAKAPVAVVIHSSWFVFYSKLCNVHQNLAPIFKTTWVVSTTIRNVVLALPVKRQITVLFIIILQNFSKFYEILLIL